MLSEILSYPFMTRSLLAGVLVGGMCGALGVFVVLRRLAYFGEGVGHASLFGVALALLAGFSPMLGALGIALLFAVLLGVTIQYTSVKEDTAIGILFSTTMALAIVILSQIESPSADLSSLLFGSLLTISDSDIHMALAASGIVFALIILLFKSLSVLVFDEPFTVRLGLPAKTLSYILLIMLAVGVVSGIRLVGVILVSSLLTVPASVALKFSQSLREALFLSTLAGVAICEGGIILSYVLNTPPGATIVVAAGIFFLIGHLFGALRESTV